MKITFNCVNFYRVIIFLITTVLCNKYLLFQTIIVTDRSGERTVIESDFISPKQSKNCYMNCYLVLIVNSLITNNTQVN